MQSFNKDIFVVIPNDSDLFIKLRDRSGKTVKTLTDDYCNIYLQNNVIVLKQTADTKQSTFVFDSVDDARYALIKLEEALAKLRINKANSNNKVEITACDNNDIVLLSELWTEEWKIPKPAENADSDVVNFIDKLQLTHIPNTYSFTNNLFSDIIPEKLDSGYKVLVYTYDNVLIPDNFKGLKIDYKCKKIEFTQGFSNLGPIQVTENKPPKVTFHKYIGIKGDFSSFVNLNSFTFKPTIENQNIFTLPNYINNIVILSINGQIISNYNELDYSYDSTLKKLTWNYIDFGLSTTDHINIIYK